MNFGGEAVALWKSVVARDRLKFGLPPSKVLPVRPRGVRAGPPARRRIARRSLPSLGAGGVQPVLSSRENLVEESRSFVSSRLQISSSEYCAGSSFSHAAVNVFVLSRVSQASGYPSASGDFTQIADAWRPWKLRETCFLCGETCIFLDELAYAAPPPSLSTSEVSLPNHPVPTKSIYRVRPTRQTSDIQLSTV